MFLWRLVANLVVPDRALRFIKRPPILLGYFDLMMRKHYVPHLADWIQHEEPLLRRLRG